MKVAIFSDTFIPEVNGVASATARLATYLEENHIPTLVVAPNPGTAHKQGHNVVGVSGFSFPLYPECKVSLPRYNTVGKGVAGFAPDLIHLVTPFTIGLCGLKLARATGVVPVATFHTDYPRYLDYYRLGMFKGMAWQYLKWFHNQCGINFCPSVETGQTLELKGISNIKVCGNGVDTELFNPSRFSPEVRNSCVPEGKIAFLYVGRLAAEKNLEILLDAFARVSARYPWAHLVITGDGPLLAKLKHKAPAGVTFTGYLSGITLAQVYASSDIFVFPSTTETFGLVILEAMASGLPVIAANAGGIKDNLAHNFNGLACRPLDPVDLAAAMELMLTDSTLRFRLAEKARPYALQKSWQKVFESMVDNYEQFIYYSKSA